jgi:hypothetical protein
MLVHLASERGDVVQLHNGKGTGAASERPHAAWYGSPVRLTGTLRAGLLTLAVAILIASSAGAKLTNHRIVLGKSIGAISVGMTRARVEQILGLGVVIGGRKGVLVESWNKLGLAFFFKGRSESAKTLGGVTTNPAYDTPQGIRIGSTTQDVTSAYGSAHCFKADNVTAENPYKRCERHAPAGRVTVFYFDVSGDVDRIAVGTDSIASQP